MADVKAIVYRYAPEFEARHSSTPVPPIDHPLLKNAVGLDFSGRCNILAGFKSGWSFDRKGVIGF
jgi:hypothetical protein